VEKMSLADKLKELRNARNWKQEYVADLMKIDRSTISRYENGKSIPPYQIVLQFAEIFGVEKEYLIDELDEMLKNANASYVLKENPEDLDFEMIRRLIAQTPSLKEPLLELALFDSWTNEYIAGILKAVIKEHKKFRRMT
jgi:transcriptional regulator with XRE-family HTH domain